MQFYTVYICIFCFFLHRLVLKAKSEARRVVQLDEVRFGSKIVKREPICFAIYRVEPILYANTLPASKVRTHELKVCEEVNFSE